MRILHINSTIVVNSGVMSVLMNYFRNIDKNKVQFDFLYFDKINPNSKTYKNEIQKLGGNVYKIANLKNIFKFNKKLDEFLKNNHYSTVQIHDPFVLIFIYKTLRRNNVDNIIVHSHATKWSDKKLNGIRNRALCYKLNSQVDYKFACSSAAGNFLYKRADFYVMNNAIDLDRYAFNKNIRHDLRNKLNLNNKLVFGHVGNMVPQKNHMFLLEVFKEIIKLNSNSILILLGDGYLRDEIERKIRENNLTDKVIVFGKKMDVYHYYQVMDCMILPSLYEGLPMVGVEAQCSGLPIVFADTITREIGTDFSDFLSLNDSFKQWAEISIKLAESNINRDSGYLTMQNMGFNIKIEALKVTEKYKEINE
ncbi:glycosyltransferase family 1 protein [Anaerococcus sp. WCA-380-WT-2B]|uniref:Glycosyltransferase family 1 protein n=1 Tax=Anaerococcus porci TaxID=2652269 RepID=A0A6N7VE06_9FIRM|nr:glycosyltransferase [Anaerococcus porci]MSS77680.1 glycosyltransferase family 1 protein [Anaerococcus porci]